MLRSIREQGAMKSGDDWLHDVPNFAWGHAHVNIHGAMMIDILYQLLQGLFRHLMEWVDILVSDLPRGPKRLQAQGERTFGEM